jgi:integrase
VLDHKRYAVTLQKALHRADITRRVRPFHDLRHTAITHEAAAENAPAAIQARAGHADYSTTQRYIHLAGVVFREEAERAEARVLGVPIVGTDSEETDRNPAGAAGLEPATPGFGDRCSAN